MKHFTFTLLTIFMFIEYLYAYDGSIGKQRLNVPKNGQNRLSLNNIEKAFDIKIEKKGHDYDLCEVEKPKLDIEASSAKSLNSSYDFLPGYASHGPQTLLMTRNLDLLGVFINIDRSTNQISSLKIDGRVNRPSGISALGANDRINMFEIKTMQDTIIVGINDLLLIYSFNPNSQVFSYVTKHQLSAMPNGLEVTNTSLYVIFGTDIKVYDITKVTTSLDLLGTLDDANFGMSAGSMIFRGMAYLRNGWLAVLDNVNGLFLVYPGTGAVSSYVIKTTNITQSTLYGGFEVRASRSNVFVFGLDSNSVYFLKQFQVLLPQNGTGSGSRIDAIVISSKENLPQIKEFVVSNHFGFSIFDNLISAQAIYVPHKTTTEASELSSTEGDFNVKVLIPFGGPNQRRRGGNGGPPQNGSGNGRRLQSSGGRGDRGGRGRGGRRGRNGSDDDDEPQNTTIAVVLTSNSYHTISIIPPQPAIKCNAQSQEVPTGVYLYDVEVQSNSCDQKDQAQDDNLYNYCTYEFEAEVSVSDGKGGVDKTSLAIGLTVGLIGAGIAIFFAVKYYKRAKKYQALQTSGIQSPSTTDRLPAQLPKGNKILPFDEEEKEADMNRNKAEGKIPNYTKKASTLSMGTDVGSNLGGFNPHDDDYQSHPDQAGMRQSQQSTQQNFQKGGRVGTEHLDQDDEEEGEGQAKNQKVPSIRNTNPNPDFSEDEEPSSFVMNNQIQLDLSSEYPSEQPLDKKQQDQGKNANDLIIESFSEN